VIQQQHDGRDAYAKGGDIHSRLIEQNAADLQIESAADHLPPGFILRVDSQFAIIPLVLTYYAVYPLSAQTSRMRP
jgi:hypothetical protein